MTSFWTMKLGEKKIFFCNIFCPKLPIGIKIHYSKDHIIWSIYRKINFTCNCLPICEYFSNFKFSNFWVVRLWIENLGKNFGVVQLYRDTKKWTSGDFYSGSPSSVFKIGTALRVKSKGQVSESGLRIMSQGQVSESGLGVRPKGQVSGSGLRVRSPDQV